MHESRRRKLAPPLADSEDEIWDPNHHPAQFRKSASRTRFYEPPQIFARIGSAGLQASLRALTAHLSAACGAIEKSPKRGDLGFEQPERQEEDDKYMIEPDFGASEVRFLLPHIRLERCECTARTGGPFSTSYLGDTGIKTSGYGDTKQRRYKPVSHL